MNSRIDLVDLPLAEPPSVGDAAGKIGRRPSQDVDAKTVAWRFAEQCESILLDYGLVEDACARYFCAAHRWNPSPAAFFWAARRYQGKQPLDLLLMLAKDDPEGSARWFDVAMSMDERQLAQRFLDHGLVASTGALRAAIVYCVEDPEFALACANAAVKSVVAGAGYRTVRRERREFRAALRRAAAMVGEDGAIFQAMREFCLEVSQAEHSLEAQELLAALSEVAGVGACRAPLGNVTRWQHNQDACGVSAE